MYTDDLVAHLLNKTDHQGVAHDEIPLTVREHICPAYWESVELFAFGRSQGAQRLHLLIENHMATTSAGPFGRQHGTRRSIKLVWIRDGPLCVHVFESSFLVSAGNLMGSFNFLPNLLVTFLTVL